MAKTKKNDTKTSIKAKKKKKSRIKQRAPLVGIFLLLVVGVGIFMYPIIGNWYTEYNSVMEINSYNSTVKNISRDTLVKLEKDASEYNKAIAEGDSSKVSVTSYNDLLAVTDALGYIEIPVIGVYLPIYHGLDESTLQMAVGHMLGTSLPIGGESTHSVLAGHTGLPSAKLFTDLDKMEIGNAFYIHVLDKVLKYEVDQIKVVLPEEARDIDIVKGEDHVTLLTCTPYGVNSHRLLVRGKRVPYDISKMSNGTWPIVNPSEERIPFRTLVWYGAAIALGVIVFVILIILLFPNMQSVKRKRAAKRAKKAEKAFERLIAEEARQIELEREAKKAAQLNGTQ